MNQTFQNSAQVLSVGPYSNATRGNIDVSLTANGRSAA
jgi:organic hydroperoxide reductase OsmC/OhrA